MKKLLSVLLLAIMLMANVSIAEKPTTALPEKFDHTVFAGLDGYYVSPEDNNWKYNSEAYFGRSDNMTIFYQALHRRGRRSSSIRCFSDLLCHKRSENYTG